MNRRFVTLVGALFAVMSLQAAEGALSARDVVERLANRFRTMKSYTVAFEVKGADFTATGSYAVEGDSYYMQVGDAEAYCDGAAKWEVDPSKREVVIDTVDLSSRNLLSNPTRAFDFLDDAFRSELLPAEGTRLPKANPAKWCTISMAIRSASLSRRSIRRPTCGVSMLPPIPISR